MLIRCIFEYFQKKRKVLTMNKKMEILTSLENGMKNLPKIQRFKFERASFRSSGGRGVDRLVIRRRDALVKGRPCYRESRYRESRVYIFNNKILIY